MLDGAFEREKAWKRRGKKMAGGAGEEKGGDELDLRHGRLEG